MTSEQSRIRRGVTGEMPPAGGAVELPISSTTLSSSPAAARHHPQGEVSPLLSATAMSDQNLQSVMMMMTASDCPSTSAHSHPIQDVLEELQKTADGLALAEHNNQSSSSFLPENPFDAALAASSHELQIPSSAAAFSQQTPRSIATSSSSSSSYRHHHNDTMNRRHMQRRQPQHRGGGGGGGGPLALGSSNRASFSSSASSSRSSSSRTISSNPAATNTSVSSTVTGGGGRTSMPAAAPPREEGRGGGLKASLDAGMASVKGWIRSRTRSGNNSGESDRTIQRLGEEDLFAMASSGQDPRSPQPPHQQPSNNDSNNTATAALHRQPTTIVEEDDSYYYDHNNPFLVAEEEGIFDEEISRQRSHSEPNVLQHFSRRTSSSSSSSSPSVRRRRQRNQSATSPQMRNDDHPHHCRHPRGRAYSTPTSLLVGGRGHEGASTLAAAVVGQPPRQLLSSSAAAALHTGGAGTGGVAEQHHASTSSASSTSLLRNTPGVAANVNSNQLRVDQQRRRQRSNSSTGSSGRHLGPESDTSAREATGTASVGVSNPDNIDGSSQARQGIAGTTTVEVDANREARMRWLRINRRFQVVITIVSIIFSLLLFAILLVWVVLTSTFVVSFDKSCDVPLKTYYWLVTFQLVLDVFRTDILRCIFRWNSNAQGRMPFRVVVYNIAYLFYASVVLRMGILSIFVDCKDECTCRETAPELFNASTAFVVLSIAAWATILLGYVVPLVAVAALLTHNGYNPAEMETTADGSRAGPTHPVFPSAYTLNGAAHCVDMLPTISMEELTEDFSHECCICMEDFVAQDRMVKTTCNHVFHKSCCRGK